MKRMMMRLGHPVARSGWLLMAMAGLMTACGGSIPAPSGSTATATTVTLQGQVTDAVTGEPIAGAQVTIGARSATTNSSGYYQMVNFPVNNSTGTGVARDYLATITLTSVTSPLDMTNVASAPRYPDRKFTAPLTPASSTAVSHDFKVGKLSAGIQGVAGDASRLPLGNVVIELQDTANGTSGNLLQTATSNATTGAYSFVNLEAGQSYRLVGHTGDWSLQGNVTTTAISDGQTLALPLSGGTALVLSNIDTYAPRIAAVTPENNTDVSPGAVDVVLTFNEPIRLDAYSTPDPATSLSNIYHDINVSYGGQKSAGNMAHTLSWNAGHDGLTISIPDTGVSSKYTVDLSLAAGKLKDMAANGLANSPVLSSGYLLSFSTSGGVPAAPPVLLSPNAASLDSNATSVILDWQPVAGATKGYYIYRSTRSYPVTSVVEPFVQLAGPVTASTYTDTLASSGFNFLVTNEVGRYYVYRVTSINSDLIESVPSNEVTVKDVIAPTAVGTAGTCVAPGGDSLTVITTPATKTTNGQVQFTFSEPLDVIAAETLGNYTGTNISAAKLTSPTTVVLDFSAPITCSNTNSVTVGVGITDVAGNALAASVVLTYVP
jgi:hypothetical protein